jgi:hypothetical protein
MEQQDVVGRYNKAKDELKANLGMTPIVNWFDDVLKIAAGLPPKVETKKD